MKRSCKNVAWLRYGAMLCVAVCLLASLNASADTRRVMVLGDSWPMFMVQANAFPVALENKGISGVECFSGIGAGAVAIGGSEIEEWAYSTGLATGALDRAVQILNDNPTMDIVVVTLGGNDFLGRWSPTSTPAEVEEIWYEAKYGADGQGGLKKVFDTLLAVRPDIRIVFSSYDYIGHRDSRIPDMDSVQAFNEANEEYTSQIIDWIDAEYKTPPRAFLANNLGITQYVYGYPGPDAGSIPSYFWPPGPPETPHAYRFGPYESLRPGTEAEGYVPLAGGDPTFRISPYYAQLDPPIDGWIHLSDPGYVTVAENVIDQYIADWLEWPKVYDIANITPDPITGGTVGGAVGLDEVVFQVTFSEPVSGVDETDFDVLTDGELTGAYVVEVAEAKDGAVYTVTVNTGSGNGNLDLAVLDNDSILDTDLNPLGGAGSNNGYFAYGETIEIDESQTVPLAAWPAGVALLAAGWAALRRKGRED